MTQSSHHDLFELKKYLKNYGIDEFNSIKATLDMLNITSALHSTPSELAGFFNILKDYHQKLINKITNSGNPSCLIILEDNSRYMINIETVEYFFFNDIIDRSLYLSLQDDEAPCGITRCHNKFIRYYIHLNDDNNIIINNIFKKGKSEITIDTYSIKFDMFRILLEEFQNTTGRLPPPTYKLTMIYNDNINCNSINDVIYKVKSECSLFLFIIKKDESLVFGWICKLDQSYEFEISLFFYILNNEIYINNKKIRNETFLHRNTGVDIRLPNYSFMEKPDKFTVNDNYIFGDNLEGFNLFIGSKVIYIDIKKQLGQLGKLDKFNFYHLHSSENYNLQIFGLNENSVNLYNFFSTDDYDNSIFDLKTNTNRQIYPEFCSQKKYCPVNKPFLCPTDSKFRLNANGTPSRGNNAPCVSDKAICDSYYEQAILLNQAKCSQNKTSVPRNLSAKQNYCKVDETQETDNGMLMLMGGNKKKSRKSYKSSKYSNRKSN